MLGWVVPCGTIVSSKDGGPPSIIYYVINLLYDSVALVFCESANFLSSDLLGTHCIPSTSNESKMASLLKAQKKQLEKLEAKGKRKAESMDVDEDEEIALKKRPRNKQRVLLLSSRGITHRMRHLMNDLEVLLPQVKKGAVVMVLFYLCI